MTLLPFPAVIPTEGASSPTIGTSRPLRSTDRAPEGRSLWMEGTVECPERIKELLLTARVGVWAKGKLSGQNVRGGTPRESRRNLDA